MDAAAISISDLSPADCHEPHRFYRSAGYDETGVRFVKPAQLS